MTIESAAAMPGATRPQFCIVDSSLRDFVGHQYAYDEAVASAAEAAGFESVVLGHHAVIAEIRDSLRVIPCFRRDIWGRQAFLPRRGGRLGRTLNRKLCNADFAADLQRGLSGPAMPRGSILLAHMLTDTQLPGIVDMVPGALPGVRSASAAQPEAADVTVVLLLRYQPTMYDNPACAAAFRQLEKLCATGWNIRLASDSARLARQIGRLTSLRFEVLPIPHTPPLPAAQAQASPVLRFASLGNARDEKGIFEILQAIDRLRREPQGLTGLEFVLQANDAAPDVAEALARMAANRPPQVTLLPDAIDGPAYARLLDAADVALLPYWRSIYEARTSGVFLEAIAGGKPVIATADTWMSDELAQHGAGLIVPDRDASALTAAIRRMADEIVPMTARARAAAPLVHARHSGAALIAQLAGPAVPAELPPQPPRRIGVLYPWGDWGHRRAGASKRSGLMVDVLAPAVEEIRVLHAGHPPDGQSGKIVTISSPPRFRLRLARWVFRLLARPFVGREGWGEELALWWHIERYLDPRFHYQLRELVRWADAILLEYPFWGRMVHAECRRQGVPYVLTALDVLAGQVRHSAALRRATGMMEQQALRVADHAVCVSPGDAEDFARHGIAAEMVPNPVDFGPVDAIPPPIEAREVLQALFDIPLPPGPFCLFVGSNFGPNRKAVDSIRNVAASMPPGSRIEFVLAGGCAAPGQQGAVLALGMVEEEVLSALYRAATAVVIPLTEGTGSSLKTVEAMAWARPVLGTSIAFRGVAVTDGHDALVQDRLEDWPAILTGLLADPLRASALGREGQLLARGFSHSSVFGAYLRLLGLPAAEVEIDEREAFLKSRRGLVTRAIERDRLDLARRLLDDT